MEIYIGKNGEVLGRYSLPELIEAIADGRVLHTDEAWYHGLQRWEAVSLVVPPLLPWIAAEKGFPFPAAA